MTHHSTPAHPSKDALDRLAFDAAEAGDWGLVDLIERTEQGDEAAAAECQRVIDAMTGGYQHPVPTTH